MEARWTCQDGTRQAKRGRHPNLVIKGVLVFMEIKTQLTKASWLACLVQ